MFLLILSCDVYSASLDFAGARNLLIQNNEALKAARETVESSREEKESLKLLHGPTFSAQAMELWGELQVDIDKKIKTPLGEMPVDIQERYKYSGPRAAVSGVLPIYSGGKIEAARKTAQYELDEAEAGLKQTGIELDARLIRKYFGLQLALSLEKLRKDTLEDEERELSRAISFEREGLISDVERMGVQVSRDAAKRNLLKATDAVKVARRELANLMLTPRVDALSTPLFVLDKSLPDIDKWQNLALKHNPRIGKAKARSGMADEQVNVAQGNFAPSVFAFGQYNFLHPWHTMMEPTWMAGVGLNWTLWSSKDRISSWKSARADLRKARAAEADVFNTVKTDLEVAWLHTNNAMGQYKLTASNVALAKENLRLKSVGFAEGLNTALDVREARTQVLAAEVERRLAAYEFVANYAMLHALAGRMDDFVKACSGPDRIIIN